MAATAQLHAEVRCRRLWLVSAALSALQPAWWLLPTFALHAIFRRLARLVVVEWRIVGSRRWRRAGTLEWVPSDDDEDSGLRAPTIPVVS